MEFDSIPSEGERNLKFKELSARLSKIAAQESVELAPFEGSHLSQFSLLTAVDQQITIAALEEYLSACEDILDRGISVRDNKAVFSRLLQSMNLNFCS